MAAAETAQEKTGWAELNTALVDGKPVVAFGNCYQAWRTGSPMWKGARAEMTRDQLAVFFNKDDDNTPGFASMDPGE